MLNLLYFHVKHGDIVLILGEIGVGYVVANIFMQAKHVSKNSCTT